MTKEFDKMGFGVITIGLKGDEDQQREREREELAITNGEFCRLLWE